MRETVNVDPDLSWLHAVSKPPPPPPPGHLNLKSPALSDMSTLPSFNDSFGLSTMLSPSPFCSTPLQPLDHQMTHLTKLPPVLYQVCIHCPWVSNMFTHRYYLTSHFSTMCLPYCKVDSLSFLLGQIITLKPQQLPHHAVL